MLARYVISDASYQTTWRVVGPAKDYTITTWYQKAAELST
jgi:hypothetical protein